MILGQKAKPGREQVTLLSGGRMLQAEKTRGSDSSFGASGHVIAPWQRTTAVTQYV